MTGTVFNIQRFSVHDGPGIRTTVFLKGCSLHCFWCHNPEGIRRKPELQVYSELCIGCGSCVQACFVGAHSFVGRLKHFDRSLCVLDMPGEAGTHSAAEETTGSLSSGRAVAAPDATGDAAACHAGHGLCADGCFTNAIAVVGEEMSVERVMEEILRDRPFYAKSGGGVTISGGEPLLQLEFTRQILEACRREGISTAIETAANSGWDALASLLPLVDLVMMDLKHMDPHKHRLATGVTNKQILENARKLAESDVPVLFRTPVIPTVNDTDEEIGAIAAFVGELRRKREQAPPTPRIDFELLAFHPLASDKYRSLDMDNEAGELQMLSADRMMELSTLAEQILRRINCADDVVDQGGPTGFGNPPAGVDAVDKSVAQPGNKSPAGQASGRSGHS